MIVIECFDFGARIQINENDAPGCCVFNICGFSFISLSVVMDTNFAYTPFWLITTTYIAREDVFEVREVSC